MSSDNRVTLKDIAAASGMSVTAVSQVLNGRPCRISKESRERIERVAHDLNYVPNQVARSLVTHRFNTLALVIPDMDSPFFSRLAAALIRRCHADGYALFVGTEFEGEGFVLSDFVASHGVDGLLIVVPDEPRANETLADELGRLRVPYVLVDRTPSTIPGDKVGFDHELGGYLATRHLVGMGHHRIACLSNLDGSETGSLRADGYRRALEKARLPFDPTLLINAGYSIASGYSAGPAVVAADVTAVFSASDSTTLGLLKYLHEVGVRVPNDLSIASYDNSAADLLFEPRLTSVEQDTDLLADQAFSLMQSRIDGGAGVPRRVSLTPHLVLGDSVRSLK